MAILIILAVLAFFVWAIEISNPSGHATAQPVKKDEAEPKPIVGFLNEDPSTWNKPEEPRYTTKMVRLTEAQRKRLHSRMAINRLNVLRLARNLSDETERLYNYNSRLESILRSGYVQVKVLSSSCNTIPAKGGLRALLDQGIVQAAPGGSND